MNAKGGEHGPSEGRAEILDLLGELASSVARTVTEIWPANDVMHETPERRMLERARRILTLSRGSCPLVIDEALQLMEQHKSKPE